MHTLLLRLNVRRRPAKTAVSRDAEACPRAAGAGLRQAKAGQSLLELALFFPILLILLSGVVEFGFLLNTFLNLIDGPREAARYAVAQNPFTGAQFSADNADFYQHVAAEVLKALSPNPANPIIVLNPSQDDVVISVFAIDNGNIQRYPLLGHLTGESATDSTVGEWHLNGRGSGCTVGVDLDCHPSRFTAADVLTRETQTHGSLMPPAMGVILVEVYYGYHQVLKLPWLAFIGDPVRLYTYTMMPMPAAAPPVTPTP